MRVVCDIEANSLTRPTKIWLIVCKDIDTKEIYIFRNLTDDTSETKKFREFVDSVTLWIGHNFLEYDWPCISRLLGISIDDVHERVCDTLILSRLIDYSRKSHSIENYGVEFGLEKIEFNDWTKWSQEMEDYCVRDIEICHRVYLKYQRVVDDPSWSKSIRMEHAFQSCVINSLHSNGFCFNSNRARKLLDDVNEELAKLDYEILKAFPPRLKLIREITPKITKHGTLSKSDFRWVANGDLSGFNGGPFCRCEWVSFNPNSHKQIVDVLREAGWVPTDRTTTHVETEREINRIKRSRDPQSSVDLADLYAKMETLKIYGWKINEENLNTLPTTAPSPARSLAKRITLESRRRTLTEWLGLVQEDNRIHGKFLGIGTWTHRMATQQPNMQNIPNEFELDGSTKYLGKELRQLWQAPRNRLLVGVDAEGIQLRIFAHYINDEEFTYALVSGKKADKSDPHSLNQRILGSACKSRAAAKRFIYALLLGAGLSKLSQILETSEENTKEALSRLLERYQGWAKLRQDIIPKDAKRGWFYGLDGRKIAIPGEVSGERKHLAMSGYLQSGEAIVMKMATLKWLKDPTIQDINFKLVNMVHDEWQTETPNNMEKAILVAEAKARALREVGEELNLKCPLAGSYWNDDHNDYTIGTNWYQTH